MVIKRGLMLFWALWLSIVFMSNIADGLKALKVLPDTWPFASGNYLFMVKVTNIYNTPESMVAILFSGVVIWEGLGALLFWRSFREFNGVNGSGLTTVYTAFGVSLALWAAFVIADEIFVAYKTANVEGTHMSVFASQLISLLVLRLLPDESVKSDSL
ncbi:MAG: hypothetical protein HY574_14040 [candidate division NC10 bacterium]|nr:hypothetical protein [candidate division NC10 bacterium]